MLTFTLPLLFAAAALASPLTERASSHPILSVSTAQWNALNSSVGGRLARGFPVARPCFIQAGAGMASKFDLATCQTIQKSYLNDSFIADNFGAYQNSNWGTCQTTGDQCQLDTNNPNNPLAFTTKTCQQGSVSTYYVNVAQASDITAIFAFALSTKVPLAIKNSGHDYKGRSSAPYSLGVWTHNLQGIKQYPAFIPEGCPANHAPAHGVTFQAGTGFLKVYQFAEANNITLLGGSSETVGVSGGWIGGGGHGALSNQLGLGVDRTLQFKVVTPDGVLRVANDCQNTDLYFALRGGGGGTFGVVMETTMIAAPAMKLQVAYVKFASVDPDATQKFMKIIIANAQKWANEGWGGYLEPSAITSQAGGFVFFTPLLTTAAAVLSMKPVTDFVNTLPNVAMNSEVSESATFFQAYSNYLVPNEELVALGTALASRLIPKDNFLPQNQGALLAAIMKGIAAAGTNVGSRGLVYGGAPTQILITTPINYKIPAGASPVAVTPAWRNTLWHILFAPTFNYDASTAEIASAFQKSATAANFVRAITPPGAYQNEASISEGLGSAAPYGDHTESFWGKDNYNRLLAIKQKIDPNNLLACWMCIGWKETDRQTNERYSCYP